MRRSSDGPLWQNTLSHQAAAATPRLGHKLGRSDRKCGPSHDDGGAHNDKSKYTPPPAEPERYPSPK